MNLQILLTIGAAMLDGTMVEPMLIAGNPAERSILEKAGGGQMDYVLQTGLNGYVENGAVTPVPVPGRFVPPGVLFSPVFLQVLVTDPSTTSPNEVAATAPREEGKRLAGQPGAEEDKVEKPHDPNDQLYAGDFDELTEPEDAPPTPAEETPPIALDLGTESDNLIIAATERPGVGVFTARPVPYSESPDRSALFGTDQVTELTRRVNADSRWDVRPHLETSSIYDGNVFLDDDETQSDFITRVSPGVSFSLGTPATTFSMLGDYTLSGVAYLENSSQNFIGHKAALGMQWIAGKLTLGTSATFSRDAEANLDTGERIEITRTSADFRSHFAYSDKVSFDLTTEYAMISSDSTLDSDEARIRANANYIYSPKLAFGIGTGFGFVSVDNGSDQATAEATFRATYVATPAVTLTTYFGVEVRDADDSLSAAPIFGVTAVWEARPGTVFTLGGTQRVFTSIALEDQNYIERGLSATVAQRLTDRCTAFLSAAYLNRDYYAADSETAATRNDNFFFIRGAFAWDLFTWCRLGAFYEYSNNISTGNDARSFQRDRAGVQFSFIF